MAASRSDKTLLGGLALTGIAVASLLMKKKDGADGTVTGPREVLFTVWKGMMSGGIHAVGAKLFIGTDVTSIASTDSNGEATLFLAAGRTFRVKADLVEGQEHWVAYQNVTTSTYSVKGSVAHITIELENVGMAGVGKVWVRPLDGGQVNGAQAGRPFIGIDVTIGEVTMVTDGSGRAGPWTGLSAPGTHAIALSVAQMDAVHDTALITHASWNPSQVVLERAESVVDQAVAVIETSIPGGTPGDTPVNYLLHVTTTPNPPEAIVQVFNMNTRLKIAGGVTTSGRVDLTFTERTGIPIQVAASGGLSLFGFTNSTTPQVPQQSPEFSITVMMSSPPGGGPGPPGPDPEPTGEVYPGGYLPALHPSWPAL